MTLCFENHDSKKLLLITLISVYGVRCLLSMDKVNYQAYLAASVTSVHFH